MKKEAKPKIKSQLNTNTAQESIPVFRAPVPRMHNWTSSASGPAFENSQWEAKDPYATPSAKRKLPNFIEEDSISRRTRGAL